MNAGIPPLRIIGHTLWLGPLLAVVEPALFIMVASLTASTGPDGGVLGSLAMLASVAIMAGPFWVPPLMAASALVGLAFSALIGLAGRAERAAPPRTVVAFRVVLGLAVVAGVAAFFVEFRQGWPAAFVLGWAVPTGGLALLLAGRPHRSPGPSPTGRRASWWGLAGLEAGAFCGVGMAILWFSASSYDPEEDCARTLGVGADQVVVGQTAFPPQSWCLSGDIARPQLPIWSGPVLVAGLTVTAVCLLMAWYWLSPSRGARRITAVVAALLIVAGTSGVVATARPRPPADAVHAAQEAVRHHLAASPPSPSPSPTASKSTITEITARFTTMKGVAEQTGGPDLLWPRPAAISTASCTDSAGATGRSVSLTGRFTTRDPATATDNVDFVAITQANEDVAQRIVNAWAARGLTGEPSPLHGEWDAGPPQGSAFTAHVGFDNGIGDILVAGECATAD